MTGALLLGAASRTRHAKAEPEAPTIIVRLAVAVFCALITAGLAAIVFLLPEPAPTLAPDAAANLSTVGVGNPITAVLLAYRAFDTFLEKVVLLFALIGVWSLAADRNWGGAPALWQSPDRDGVLTFLGQILPPVGVVVAIYMLWTGADHPGGAFQASAMLAAMWMLTMIAGLTHAPRISSAGLRLTLVFGAAAFLLVGLAGFYIAGAFLAYPPGYSKALIIAIEVVMTISVAGTLVLWSPVLRNGESGHDWRHDIRTVRSGPGRAGFVRRDRQSAAAAQRSLPSIFSAAACSSCSASLRAEARQPASLAIPSRRQWSSPALSWPFRQQPWPSP